MGRSQSKIVTIVGARPQFVKASTVSRAVAEHPDITEVLVHTGQHYDDNMSEVFFRELGIPKPHHHLGIGSGSHGEQTGRMIEGIERLLLAEAPDWVVVYGDTNSTLAGAVAAAKLNLPLAHVEAGLRSFDRRMPEELNRVLTDHASNLLFAPTSTAMDHLRSEGLADRARLVGDVMYDAALHYARLADDGTVAPHLEELPRGTYLLATIHRAENTDDPSRLQTIVRALAAAAAGRTVVLPLHPRTRKAIDMAGLMPLLKDVRVIDPVGYVDMIRLERDARTVVTDSGGVQKEAYFFGVPCVTLRSSTEWTETLHDGWNRLVDPLTVEGVEQALHAAGSLSSKSPHPLYGDGHASRRIVDALLAP